jgi:hypothetical protein
VQRSLAFIENRRMLIKIEPNLDAWVDWAERDGKIHHLAIAFAKYKPGIVFADSVPEKPGPFCTPRSLVKLSFLIGQLGIGAFTEAAQGYIGEGAGAEFVSFLRVAESMPTFEEIVANPEKVKVPEKSDAGYAVMQMLAHRVSSETVSPVFAYLTRMGREFQVAGLRSAFRRCPELMKSKDFAEWLREKKNRDLVIAANLLDKS